MPNDLKKYTIAIPFKFGNSVFTIIKKSPWSIIDYLFLDTLNSSSMSLDNLSIYSNFKKQLVVQILLPMIKLGWIELISSDKDFIFEITDSGKNAVGLGKLPDIEEVYERYREFALDSFYNYYGLSKFKFNLEPEARVNELKQENENFIKYDLDFDEVYPDYNEIYKSVAFDNEIVKSMRRDFHYSLFQNRYLIVDLLYNQVDKTVNFLDEDMAEGLKPEIVDFIKNIKPDFNKKVESKRIVSNDLPLINNKSNFTVSEDDLEIVAGALEHKDKILYLLKNSIDYLVLHTTFIGKWCIFDSKINQYSDIFIEIKAALIRGVTIYLMWGKDEPDENQFDYEKSIIEIKDIEELLEKFNNQCIQEGILNTINLNNFVKTGSHTKFIITNIENVGPTLLMGSCNYLYTQYERFEASVYLKDVSIVKRMIQIAADMSTGKDFYSTNVREELLLISEKIIDSHERKKRNINISLVLKGDHYKYIDLAKHQAKKNIYILSDKLNDIFDRPICDALKNSMAKKYAFFSDRSENFSHDQAVSLIERLSQEPYKINIRLHSPKTSVGPKKKKNHAKVLTWDNDNLLITSLNWLSSNASLSSKTTEDYHEIGFYIRKENIAREFIEKFMHS